MNAASIQPRLVPPHPDCYSRVLLIEERSRALLGKPPILTPRHITSFLSWDRVKFRAIRLGSQTVGFTRTCACWESRSPYLQVQITVDPGFRRLGVGNCIFEKILSEAQGLAAIDTKVFSEDNAYLSFLVKRGFSFLQDSWNMIVPLDAVPVNQVTVPPGFQIRPYCLGRDKHIFAGLYNATFHSERLFWPLTADDVAKIESRAIFDPSLVMLLYTNSEKPIGLVHAIPNYQNGQGWIENIGVLPEYQCQGLGRFLLRYAMQKLAHSAGLNKLLLSVESSNYQALQLYYSVGFVRTERHLRMRKELGA